MLTCCRLTAWISRVSLVWAVFSSQSAFSADRPLISLESGMNDLIYTLSRSVVTVQNIKRVGTAAYGNPSNETVENLVASGLVVDSSGHILTSATAVAGHDDLIVSFENNQVPARLVAIDYYNDLALLIPTKRLGQPVRISQRRVCAGQMVVAMGHAYGLRASPVIGFCAGVRPDGNLQFSVPIGQSAVGGGVFDLGGNLLGILTATMGPMTGVAIAVPAYNLPPTVTQLLIHGDRQAGYIGVSTADIEITPGIEVQASAPWAGPSHVASMVVDKGVIVTYIAPSSPAAEAGLVKGDVIIDFQGGRINTALDLAQIVRQTRPGTTAIIGYIRNNQYQTARLRVGQKTLSSQFSETNQFEAPELSPDSLTKMLQYLKQEVTRLENRVKRAR